jgi:hypothetical protein
LAESGKAGNELGVRIDSLKVGHDLPFAPDASLELCLGCVLLWLELISVVAPFWGIDVPILERPAHSVQALLGNQHLTLSFLSPRACFGQGAITYGGELGAGCLKVERHLLEVLEQDLIY